jgi:hypothetical protein
MRRLTWAVPAVLLLTASVSACHRGLEQGNLLSIHVMTVTLKPGVTMEQFTAFYEHQVLPAYERNWRGLRAYLLRSFFHDAPNKLAVVWLFRTVEDRNRNFDANDRANALERASLAKVQPVVDSLKALYGDFTVEYSHQDDWVVGTSAFAER